MPHKLPSVNQRPKVIDDVLIETLEHLDPSSLWCASAAYPRVHSLATSCQPLRRTLEAAYCGMELGSATWLTKSSAEGLLSTFYMEWQALNWPQYGSASLASDVIADISGGVYYTLSRVPNHAISLALLPSARSRSHLPPSIIRSGYADCVAVNKPHGLLVVATIRNPANGTIALTFCDMAKSGAHPQASQATYEFVADCHVTAQNLSLYICGAKLLVSVKYEDARANLHWVFDWANPHANTRFTHFADACFINEQYLLAVSGPEDAVPHLALCNISNLAHAPLDLHFLQLSSAWSHMVLSVHPNSSLTTTDPAPSDAVFYADPHARIALVTGRAPGHPDLCHSLFIKESSLLAFATNGGGNTVAWGGWQEKCLFTRMNPGLVEPQVCGTKVVYVIANDKPAGGAVGGVGSYLVLVDLAPYRDAPRMRDEERDESGMQVAKEVMTEGSQSGLYWTVTKRPLGNLEIERIRVTEDNIVLFDSIQDPAHNAVRHRRVAICTFGMPTKQP